MSKPPIDLFPEHVLSAQERQILARLCYETSLKELPDHASMLDVLDVFEIMVAQMFFDIMPGESFEPNIKIFSEACLRRIFKLRGELAGTIADGRA